MLLDGMHLPVTTPFLPDGRLNPGKLEDNVKRYSRTPAAGLMVLTQSGQPTLLSDSETRELLRVVAQAATIEKVLTAGIRRDSVREVLDLVAYAAEVGFDVALVPVPSLLRGGTASKEILGFFMAVADSAELPLLLDSGPPGDGELTAEAVIELAQHPNVIGMLDSAGYAPRWSSILAAAAELRREVTVTAVFAAVTRRMAAHNLHVDNGLLPVEVLSGGGVAAPLRSGFNTRIKSVGFQILCGRTAGMLDALTAGASGAAPPLAAAAPQACYEVLAAWKDGDPALAAEKQQRLHSLAARVEEQLGVVGIKYGCDLNGYFGGRPRLPMLPLSRAEREEIESLMAGIRN